MVKERAPSKAAGALGSGPRDLDSKQRETTPDSDTDLDDLFKGLAPLKPSSPMDAPRGHPATAGRHHSSMMSSRKQKANHSNLFNNQRGQRPEHHVTNTANRVSGPRAPSYQDRRAPPLQTFDSMTMGPPAKTTSGGYEDHTFYTDPNKAGSELKDLLEGNLEESEDEEEDPAKKEGSSPEKADGNADDEAKKEGESKKDPKDGSMEGLKVKLLPHQVEGVSWMRGRELGPVKRGKVPKGGILADDMGLGKTLQTISLILSNQRPERDSKRWKKHYEGIEKTTLVVAPLALIKQWESEMAEKICKSHRLKVYLHHGQNRAKSYKEFASYDVVITTYGILSSEHKTTSPTEKGVKTGCFGIHWWRIVLDEAHSIKNRNAKASKACCDLKAEYRWCLSGTPMQNNLDELQALVKFLRIAPYDDLKQWREHFDAPMRAGKGHIAIRRLHSLLRCFMKRRRKEILKEAGALNPGGKPTEDGEASTGFKVTERKVVSIEADFSPAERRFYSKVSERADESLEKMMKGKQLSYTSAMVLLLRLRQLCDHPKLVEGKLDSDKDAMSMGGTQEKQQRTQDADMDSMADMFAGMGIQSKACGVCGTTLSKSDTDKGLDHCSECQEDLAHFNDEGAGEKKPDKKSKRVKKVKKQKVIKKARRPRNRQAILDSDDEDDEGSWLVPEDERGETNLGKAGGSEDENAEGGGDSIGPDDSEDDEEDEGDEGKSNLSSFVVNDEDDDDDDLPTLEALTQKMASQTLEDKPKSRPPKASTATSETEDSGSDDDDDEEGDETSRADSEEEDSDSEASSDLGIDASEISQLDGDDSVRWDDWQTSKSKVLPSAKIREILRILEAEAREHKFIIFSQFTSMMDLVEPFLRRSGFRFVRYDGSMKNDEREESLKSLREDARTRILLCSLKCGSLGLNLTAATRVIIVEPFWNPFVEEQAIDRVHRLTQKIDVVVYKLTIKDTIETRMLGMQDQKRLLAEQAIEGGMKKNALKLGLADIIDLFRPGQADEDGGYAGAGAGGMSDPLQITRDVAAIGKKRVAKQANKERSWVESDTYGRRW
ncbi:hypothetical protein N3K66_004986 [Trichothecium roseum]|uniref:Uncharacterized protein n=1 Tax=Trichothecium roseum TaxID=47278 RepID=A0ACC0V4A5_9HYPO|nr:hypothetical protein N3K66_004986 [Trichothecium roseum]